MPIKSSTRDRRALPWATLILVSLLAAGCGVSSTTGATAPTSTPSISASPTATETPAPNPTATPEPPCDTTAQFANATRAGDLLLSDMGVNFLYGAPGVKLPDATPLKPVQIQYGPSTSGLLLSGDPLTNPKLQEDTSGSGGGYEIDICNASATQTHTIQAVTARLTGFTSYSGPLQEWPGGCAQQAFDAKTRGPSDPGCGGGPYSPCEYMHANFLTTAGVGAKVIAKQTGDGRDVPYGSCGQFGPLPVALAPGVAMSVNIGVTAPTAQGTYSFAFGFVVDGAAPAYISVTPTLLAPIAHLWGYCTTAVEAQIPTTKDDTYYICPQ
ncbi:MAG TPA: hypothetical protein VF808_19575 [Ktedonobacterales bacterium]